MAETGFQMLDPKPKQGLSSDSLIQIIIRIVRVIIIVVIVIIAIVIWG